MTRATTLTAGEIERLCAILPLLGRIGIPKSQIEALRSLVLWPSIERWDIHHRTPVDAEHTMQLWQAVCHTSPGYQHVVAVDDFDVRHWLYAPDSEMLLRALQFALL